MKNPEDKSRHPTHDLYDQEMCAGCGRAVYVDEALHLAENVPLCHDCYTAGTVARKSLPEQLFEIRVPVFGVSLIEILAVVLILGVLTSIAVPQLLSIKARTERHVLELLFIENDDPEISKLATDIVEGKGSLPVLVGNAARVTGAPPDEVKQLEEDLLKDLRKYEDSGSKEVQVGAIIRTIEKWKKKLSKNPEQAIELPPELQ